MTRDPSPHSAPRRDPRVRIRCPGCGSTTTTTVRGGTVRNASLAHEEYCTWLAAAERGARVAPVEIKYIKEERS